MFLLLLKLLVSGFPPVNLLLSKVSGTLSYSPMVFVPWFGTVRMRSSVWFLFSFFLFSFPMFLAIETHYIEAFGVQSWKDPKMNCMGFNWEFWILELGRKLLLPLSPPNHMVSEDPVISSHPFADLIPQKLIICSMWTCVTHPYSQ